MVKIYKTENGELTSIDNFAEGAWVNLVRPSEAEIQDICNKLGVAQDFVMAALDEEERPRIEYEDGQVLIIVDIPTLEKEHDGLSYSTLPLGIIIADKIIITVCLKEDTILQDFINGRVKAFQTAYRTRFIFQILHRNATQFLQYLRQIDKASNRIEQELHRSMRNKELFELLKLQEGLVYFSTSLKSNELVLEKLLRHDYIKKFPEDEDLLDDVIVENRQAIEMANIYSSILSGTMDAYASIISNNVNFVMKHLTVITIVMAIPTMVASFFGMNVNGIPFAGNEHGFALAMGISAVLTLLAGFLFVNRKI